MELTYLRGQGWRGLEEICQRTYRQLCIAPGQRQQCGESQSMGQGLVGDGQIGGNGGHL